MTAEPGLADKVVLLHTALSDAGIAHAFGGALALAYYAEPRVTVDIDVNVFIDPIEYPRLLDVLAPFGVTRAPSPATVARVGQGRVWWGRNPLDLFFAYDEVHAAMQQRARTVPFGSDTIPILAAEHLVVAKIAFDRAKDWIDIEQLLLATPAVDVAEVSRWLTRLVGADDDRYRRFDDLRVRLLG